MKKHDFNFDGGADLRKIGASWFVSYAYYEKNGTHDNWRNVKTYNNRISIFKKTTKYHQYWLTEVLKMTEARLNTNKIFLDAKMIKQMAKELLGI